MIWITYVAISLLTAAAFVVGAWWERHEITDKLYSAWKIIRNM